ncbi:MAG: YopT-type cysteine protease domain-containing protein [Desulfobacterales bacterium]|nr:YopT-type cysteine protease domain-containing protein [Desulfobacterales bacterium]
MNDLRKCQGFQELVKGDQRGRFDPKRFIERTVNDYRNNAWYLEHRFKIDLKYVYNQDLDIRPHQSKMPHVAAGWCQGLCSYWLKSKRMKKSPFPELIYDNPELSSDSGAPIKLMSNQKKLVEHADLIKTGDMDPRLKNAMEYVLGGPSKNRAPVIHVEGGAMRKENVSQTCRQFQSALGRPSADGNQFFISADFDVGSHAIAMDLDGVELFDPNWGVFSSTYGGPKALVDFLFHGFFELYYPGTGFRQFYIARVI